MVKTKADMVAWMKKTFSKYDWKLFVFLLLVLNVKLVVKILVILFFCYLNRSELHPQKLIREKAGWFYLSMILIGLVNLLMQYQLINFPYLIVSGLGLGFWLLSFLAVRHIKLLTRNIDKDKLNKTITAFFLLHIILIFGNLLHIMWQTGTVNPYTFKGFNQKFYLSTGDSIFGITFDSPVTTAAIAAFGVIYFLYNHKYFFSLLSMTALLIMFSNLTNIFLLLVLGSAFIFRTDRIQKSMAVIFLTMTILFISKVSPQNNEYVVSFVYKLIGKAYYLPPVKIITNDELKTLPDSVLTSEQQRQKIGLLFIDSLYGLKKLANAKNKNEPGPLDSIANLKALLRPQSVFYQYRPSAAVAAKENRFGSFLKENYPGKVNDSLLASKDWEKPGKQISFEETVQFLQKDKKNLLLGSGIGNFSSRIAFKASALGIAGSYPVKYRYIHPLFMMNHLYIYLSYHAQWQIKHSAANTPDSVYNQILGEYGLVGMMLFLILFFGYYFKLAIKLHYALPLLLLLMALFFVEYWFEQLSMVILFELLFWTDFRNNENVASVS